MSQTYVEPAQNVLRRFFLPSRAKAKGKADLASGTITDSLILEFHIQI